MAQLEPPGPVVALTGVASPLPSSFRTRAQRPGSASHHVQPADRLQVHVRPVVGHPLHERAASKSAFRANLQRPTTISVCARLAPRLSPASGS